MSNPTDSGAPGPCEGIPTTVTRGGAYEGEIQSHCAHREIAEAWERTLAEVRARVTALEAELAQLKLGPNEAVLRLPEHEYDDGAHSPDCWRCALDRSATRTNAELSRALQDALSTTDNLVHVRVAARKEP